ncbi:MAG: LysR family transcriptional regulator [Acidimicrobiia bacterium]|nr:LysR family transcriptional regulator [Acidimicrobiia bacterium]
MNSAHLSPSPLLDVLHLEAICAIENHGRLAGAAASLHVTPSALSHRISEAERRLGIKLYVRAHRRLEPTAAATYLAKSAASLLEELARVESDSRRMTGAVRRVVRLAVDTYRSYHWLPEFLAFVRSQRPDIELQVSSAGSDQPTARVEAGSLDVAIAPGDRPSAHLRDEFLFDDELVFISPPDHPLAAKSVVTGPDIEGVDFITYTRTPEPDREFARLFRPSNAYPSWVETIELPEAIVEMVAAGLGTSVLSRWAIENSITQKRVASSSVGAHGITVPWHAFTRPDDDDALAIAELLVTWCARRGSLAGHSRVPAEPA